MPDQTHGYEIGYGKPPKSSQFKKGKSGNPKGRPKNSPNAAAMFDELLRTKVQVTERGRKTDMTKLAVIMQRVIDAACLEKGKAPLNFLQYHKYFSVLADIEASSEPDDEQRKELIAKLVKRMKGDGLIDDQPEVEETPAGAPETERRLLNVIE